MLKDIIEETQKKLTEKFLGINTVPDDAWHTSIYERKAQQIDEIVAETAQIVAREVLRKAYTEMAEVFDTNENEDYKPWQYANDHLQSLEDSLLKDEEINIPGFEGTREDLAKISIN
jgi:hypothetical protein